MNGGQEGGRILGVACGDAAPTFEVEKGIFHQMAKFIEVAVVVALNAAALSGRDDRRHALPCGLLKDGVGIVTPVGEQIGGAHSLDKSASLRAISGGAFRNKDSDRQTMRIHGQMQLGVEPPFVRLMD